MSDYEGLNLPQLLDLLQPSVMPDAVSWVPRTPGWWVLVAWLLVVAALLFIKLVQRRRRNRYRREADALLSSIEAGARDNPVVAAAQVARLLKRTALAVYPRRQVASLYGADWAAFLVTSAGDDPLVKDAAPALAEAACDPNADGRALVQPARRWIQVHRA